LFGQILATKLFAPIINVGGRILFVSSGFGLMGPAGYSVYAGAKAGIVNFAESIKRELYSYRIGVYVAVPSDIDTPGFREEKRCMPGWLARSKARGSVLSAHDAAKKIVSKCKGSRFLIFSDYNVFFLHIMTKILPKYSLDKIINKLFPRPE